MVYDFSANFKTKGPHALILVLVIVRNVVWFYLVVRKASSVCLDIHMLTY